MHVDNALAGIAVKDVEAAASWYEMLLGAAGQRPMKEVVEWLLPRGGVLQVFGDAKRAGYSSVTLSVSDLQLQIDRLAKLGIAATNRTSTSDVSTAMIEDPDGNRIVLAEQHSSKVAR